MSKIAGLTEQEALQKKIEFGENLLPLKESFSRWVILFGQLKSPLIYIILVVGIVSILFREFNDALLIMAVVVLNVAMGYFQEYNAQKTLAALRKIIKPLAIVIRNGERKEIYAKDLVPGDIVLLGSGDKVPADGKIIEGAEILISEAILTGEEEPVSKDTTNNKVFMGATVINGIGTMEVTGTGIKTEIGKIGLSLAEIKEEPTPLQKKLEEFSKNLVLIILALCLVILITILLSQQPFWESFKITIVLTIAAIPEGLPIVVTVILALGMNKILKRNGLVKKLLSIETLGSTSVICTDKTGTLTEGKMEVVRVDFTDPAKALLALALANNRRNSVDFAVWDYIKKIENFDLQIDEKHSKTYHEPFSSEKKYSMVVVKNELEEAAYMMGAPEIVMEFCGISKEGGERELEKFEKWSGEGLRVISVAYKQTGELKEKKGFSWLGLVGIEDPIRSEVKEAIDTARSAGIKIKIVTGDYRKTAEKIGSRLGFKTNPENVMEGYELEAITEEDLKKKIEHIEIFSRVTPHQKLKIVKILQELGEVVAMTGDGVNDAPALKKADIGVAVGNATDVAKEAAKLILLDSNFKTIVAACEEGRIIFSNIKKVVAYILSNSFVEMVVIVGALFMGLPSPLTVTQILWLHLICDGPPDIILGFEPGEKNIMKERPKNMRREKILDGSVKFMVTSISIFVGILSLFVFEYYYRTSGNLTLARTIIFGTLASVDLIYIFSFKNLRKPIYKIDNFFKNKYLFLGVLYGFTLVFSAIYVPKISKALGTTAIHSSQWIPIIAVGLASIVLVEIIKAFFNYKEKHSSNNNAATV